MGLEMLQMSGHRGAKSVPFWNRCRKLSIPSRQTLIIIQTFLTCAFLASESAGMSTITVTAGFGSLTPQTIQLTLTVH